MILLVDSREAIPEFINFTKCNPVSTENGFLVSVQSSSLMIWIEDNKVVLDTGHGLPITTVCVSASSNPYVCSCSDDKVIMWSLEDFSSNHNSRTPNPGLLVGLELGSISDCSISCDNTWLALCRESDVLIVRLQHTDGVLNAVSHHATLESPGEAPSFCRFSPMVANLLVTADDSNTFKVWDTQSGQVVHHAALGGWHRISFCEFVLCGSHQGHLLVGSNRGVLHLFSVSISKPPRGMGHVSATPPSRSSVSVTADDLGVVANTEKGSKSGNDHITASRLPATPPGMPPSTPPAGPPACPCETRL
ncbi:WD repeat-containing protein 27-like [Thrips palmi]|uniref:WD repeat-containing protein 27-like n=1 Tax=Thrips palmi TaxID=161013 RepID=A0A6P9A0E5_THRPL|nr:WD repeat-containing protein 27-like [Thrips palmi]